MSITSQQDLVLNVQSLAKTYTTFRKDPGIRGAITSFFHRVEIPIHAVHKSSFTIRRGEFVGLLGPNGAGKTTILKMLSGLIPPSSGVATAFGQYDTRLRLKPYLRRIGMVMGQRNQLHPDLPAMDSFRLSQAIYGIGDSRFAERLKTCLDLFQIHHKVDVPVRKLSLGERMKMELILAILHEPELLFLDEPTIGLDFNAAKQIRQFLAETNRKLGITIVLTSHYTKDIEELCRRVIVINHGSIAYDGPLDGLDQRIQGERVFSVSTNGADPHTKLKTWISQAPGIVFLEESEPHTLSFAVPTPLAAATSKELFNIIESDQVVDLSVQERALEDIFSELYAKEAPVS